MDRRWDKSKPPQGPFALNRDCPQARGLVAWYPMGMAGSGVAFDHADKRHVTGTSNAGTLLASGAPALAFASASSHGLSVTSVPASNFSLSIAAWFRPATAHSGTVAGLASNTGSSGWGRKLLYCYSDGTIRLYCQDDGGTSAFPATTTSYTVGQLVHGAAVFSSASDYRVFLNGGSKGTSSSTVNFGSPDRIRIGDDNTGGNYFNGDIGEVGFWNIALSDDLIFRLYDSSTRFELWYPLRSRKWFAQVPGGYTHPTLSNARMGSLTTTGGVPLVDYTF